MGERILSAVRDIRTRHESIGDVRGKGLVVGVELVKDAETKEPAPELSADVIDRAFAKGLLLLSCGPSTVRFMPALTIEANIVDEAMSIFEDSLAEAEGKGG
jgi:4-aminobutyrate aminotransferase